MNQASNDKPFEFKQGENYQATIKERINSNEAVIQVRGKEATVKFDGNVPAKGQAMIQMVGKQQDQAIVKVVHYDKGNAQPANGKSNDVTQLLKGLGQDKVSIEVKQAAQIFIDKGVPLTKETVQSLKSFFEKGSGTIEQKLATTSAMAEKQLAPTSSQLAAVHEALHGRTVSDAFSELEQMTGRPGQSSAQSVEQALRQVYALMKNGEDYTATLKQLSDQFSNQSAQLRKAFSEIQQMLKAGHTDAAEQRFSELLRSLALKNEAIRMSDLPLLEEKTEQHVDVKAQFMKEGNLDKALEHVRSFLDGKNGSEFNGVREALEKASLLQQQGRELKARQEVIHALEKVEGAGNRNQVANAYVQNELQTNQTLTSKDMIVRTVTEKLSQAAIDFKQIKRGITRNLDSTIQLIQQHKKSATPQANQILESTIKKLDNAILKSEMMLFTDMKTEKQLMKASSQLAEARSLLAKGDFTSASKIVTEVKTLMEQTVFKPSDVKVKHFISQKSLELENRPPVQQAITRVQEAVQQIKSNEGSPRQVFELVRSLGLTNESDTAKALAFQQGNGSNNSSGQQDQMQRNMKAVLIQLLQQSDESQGRIAQLAESTLNNLTGQQLLSKSDSGTNLQSLFFQLPMQLEKQTENLQVYINSKNKGEQVDWENCNLYFFIETKKLGEIGIQLNVSNRNLSITLKNDSQNFKEKLIPLVDVAKKNMEEIGYQVGKIDYARLKKQEQIKIGDTPNDQPTTNVSTDIRKGMDFTI